MPILKTEDYCMFRHPILFKVSSKIEILIELHCCEILSILLKCTVYAIPQFFLPPL